MDFMRGFFGLIIPIVIICIPSIYQLVLLQKRLDNKTSLSQGMIFLWTLALGIICPITATYMSMRTLAIGMETNDVKCMSGIELFMILGAGVAFFVTPFIGIVGYIIERNNPKRKAS